MPSSQVEHDMREVLLAYMLYHKDIGYCQVRAFASA